VVQQKEGARRPRRPGRKGITPENLLDEDFSWIGTIREGIKVSSLMFYLGGGIGTRFFDRIEKLDFLRARVEFERRLHGDISRELDFARTKANRSVAFTRN